MITKPNAQDVKVYECDFLVVGGGDAGCSAAIKAAEEGVTEIPPDHPANHPLYPPCFCHFSDGTNQNTEHKSQLHLTR